MTFFDWLASPHGIEVEHAVIALITAIAGYLAYLSRREAKTNKDLLNGHLEQHAMNDTKD